MKRCASYDSSAAAAALLGSAALPERRLVGRLRAPLLTFALLPAPLLCHRWNPPHTCNTPLPTAQQQLKCWLVPGEEDERRKQLEEEKKTAAPPMMSSAASSAASLAPGGSDTSHTLGAPSLARRSGVAGRYAAAGGFGASAPASAVGGASSGEGAASVLGGLRPPSMFGGAGAGVGATAAGAAPAMFKPPSAVFTPMKEEQVRSGYGADVEWLWSGCGVAAEWLRSRWNVRLVVSDVCCWAVQFLAAVLHSWRPLRWHPVPPRPCRLPSLSLLRLHRPLWRNCRARPVL